MAEPLRAVRAGRRDLVGLVAARPAARHQKHRPTAQRARRRMRAGQQRPCHGGMCLIRRENPGSVPRVAHLSRHDDQTCTLRACNDGRVRAAPAARRVRAALGRARAPRLTLRPPALVFAVEGACIVASVVYAVKRRPAADEPPELARWWRPGVGVFLVWAVLYFAAGHVTDASNARTFDDGISRVPLSPRSRPSTSGSTSSASSPSA